MPLAQVGSNGCIALPGVEDDDTTPAAAPAGVDGLTCIMIETADKRLKVKQSRQQLHDELTIVDVLGTTHREQIEHEKTLHPTVPEVAPVPDLTGEDAGVLSAPTPSEAANATAPSAPVATPPLAPPPSGLTLTPSVAPPEADETAMAHILALQAECFAEDVPILDEMVSWTEDQICSYFESGGSERP